MPRVSVPGRILVTGASGFVASHLSRALLHRGHTVVGTVRSREKGLFLERLHNSPAFSFKVVEDITQPNAIDHLLRDIDCVHHTASPFHFAAQDPDEIIGPAVNGTLGVLESVKAHGHSVKRVLLTSSTAAIITPSDAPRTFTEVYWNTHSPAQITHLGADASGMDKYQASKTLAERAAWAFVAREQAQARGERADVESGPTRRERVSTRQEGNAVAENVARRETIASDFAKRTQADLGNTGGGGKGGLGWDLVTLCPPFIFGPIIHEVPDPSKLNTSSAIFRSWMSGDPPPSREEVVAPFLNLVDVRDVALAHVRAMEVEQAGGQRYIVSNGPFCIQDIYDDLHSSSGDKRSSQSHSDIPRGWPGHQPPPSAQSLHDGSKAVRELGLAMTPRGKTVWDTWGSLERLRS